MEDLNAIADLIAEQQRAPRGKGRMQVICIGCGERRLVSICDWRKRRSDFCKPCTSRVRVGLKPGGNSGKGTRLYNIWRNMRQRCGLFHGGKARDLEVYHERGIVVCESWATSFEPFKQWALTSGYAENLVIDRKDNEKGYEPSNCRWITIASSNRNRRRVYLTERQTVEVYKRLKSGDFTTKVALAREYGVPEWVVYYINTKRFANVSSDCIG
jgi:hypothetical protein